MFVVKVLCLYPLRNFFLHFVTKSIVIHTCMTRQKSTLSSETPLNRCSVKKTAFRCVVIFINDNLDPVAKLNNLYIVHCCNLCTFSVNFWWIIFKLHRKHGPHGLARTNPSPQKSFSYHDSNLPIYGKLAVSYVQHFNRQ